jgi:hypothetical protein
LRAGIRNPTYQHPRLEVAVDELERLPVLDPFLDPARIYARTLLREGFLSC